MCTIRQIPRNKDTNSQAHENHISRYWVHSYLDICTIDPAAVMQSHASNRSTDNSRIPNSTKMATAAAAEKDQIIMMPVATSDFLKLNEIAESLMVVKDLQQAEQIKELRNKLLHVHNCVHCFKINKSA